MTTRATNKVIDILPESPADVAGIRNNDRLISINGNVINDELDLAFYSQETSLLIKLKRGNKTVTALIQKEEYESTGITLDQLKIQTCKNNCIFCFVNQLPKGLRRSLYVKDEDYRFSFLFGNYVTLSNLTKAERKRIIEQRMSPLYISVHTTNHELRKTMLGNKKASNIITELKMFKSKKIKFHTQIVLCPGYNDGKELESTIRDLSAFFPYMMSVAVVPAGLTKHRGKPLTPVSRDDSTKAINMIEKFQKRFLKKYGDAVVFGSDELFIKAGLPFPPVKLYGDFPQIENGVGMVPDFIHSSHSIKLSSYTFSKRKFITFSGVSFYPYLERFIDKIIENSKVSLDMVPVINYFFGESVTVTGLLTGRDIIKTLSDKTGKDDIILIPDVVLKDSDTVLLDDITIRDISDVTKAEVRVIESSPTGLLKGLEEKYEY
jgi:putative radical SAM enzyme (TIGR03279 family)